MRLLIGAARQRPTAEEIATARHLAAASAGGVSAKAIVQHLGLSDGAVHRVFCMVYCGHLRPADPKASIDGDTLLVAADA